MRIILKILLLSFIITTVTNAQKLSVGGNYFINNSRHLDEENDIMKSFYSYRNIEGFVRYKVPYLFGIESGFKLSNIENLKYPAYYLALPLKIYFRSNYENFNAELGGGFWQGISLAKGYNNSKALSASLALFYNYNDKESLFFKVEFLKFLDPVYRTSPNGSPGTLGGGRQYDYFANSRSIGFGMMFHLR